MTKKAFTVDTGLFPNHNGVDIGHTSAQFRDVHIDGDIAMASGGEITIGGTAKVSEQDSAGGGVTDAKSIAYSIALG